MNATRLPPPGDGHKKVARWLGLKARRFKHGLRVCPGRDPTAKTLAASNPRRVGRGCRGAKAHARRGSGEAKRLPGRNPTATRLVDGGTGGARKLRPVRWGPGESGSLPWSWGCRGSRNAPLTGDATATRCAGGSTGGGTHPWQDCDVSARERRVYTRHTSCGSRAFGLWR